MKSQIEEGKPDELTWHVNAVPRLIIAITEAALVGGFIWWGLGKSGKSKPDTGTVDTSKGPIKYPKPETPDPYTEIEKKHAGDMITPPLTSGGFGPDVIGVPPTGPNPDYRGGPTDSTGAAYTGSSLTRSQIMAEIKLIQAERRAMTQQKVDKSDPRWKATSKRFNELNALYPSAYNDEPSTYAEAEDVDGKVIAFTDIMIPPAYTEIEKGHTSVGYTPPGSTPGFGPQVVGVSPTGPSPDRFSGASVVEVG